MKIDSQLSDLAPASSVDLSGHPRYRSDIDGLRAVAVLSVVAFHAFPNWLRGGFIGVDIFFVISGFLISGIIADALARGRFTFAGFYARRIRRIFPALIVVLASCLAFGWFALFPDEYRQLGKHVAGGAGFVSNLLFWNEVGYFDTAAETKPLLHLWSLAIEEQFYIFWPVLLLLAWRWRMQLLLVTAVLAAASFALNVGGIAGHPTATFYSPASRAWELLAGALLACALRQPGAMAALARQVRPGLLSGAGAALLALGLATIVRGPGFPGWPALLPVAGATLLIAAGPAAWVNRHLLSNRVLVWVGLISYPLYLWHWPLLSFAQIIESATPSPAIRGYAVGAAFVLAWLTYRLVERPLRHRPGRATVVTLCALMAALALAGGYAWRKEGLPKRAAVLENAQNQKALVLVEDTANAAACKKRYGFDSLYEYCLLDKVDQPPTVALIGDSHGYHVVAGLTRYYRSEGENLLFLGTRVPFWGLPGGTDGYQLATQQMLELALATPSVKTVLLSTALRLEEVSPLGRSYAEAARETLRRFTRAGKQIIWMNDIPFLSFEPRSCIKRAGIASSTTRSPCAMPRSDFDKATPQHDIVLARLAAEFPAMQIFQTASHLCDARFCWASIGGKLLYRDLHHLSYDGDLYIGEKFAQKQHSVRAKAEQKP
jgi:peptidoglycan/LPS O-acetylase OafA/YrhL